MPLNWCVMVHYGPHGGHVMQEKVEDDDGLIDGVVEVKASGFQMILVDDNSYMRPVLQPAVFDNLLDLLTSLLFPTTATFFGSIFHIMTMPLRRGQIEQEMTRLEEIEKQRQELPGTRGQGIRIWIQILKP